MLLDIAVNSAEGTQAFLPKGMDPFPEGRGDGNAAENNLSTYLCQKGLCHDIAHQLQRHFV